MLPWKNASQTVNLIQGNGRAKKPPVPGQRWAQYPTCNYVFVDCVARAFVGDRAEAPWNVRMVKPPHSSFERLLNCQTNGSSFVWLLIEVVINSIAKLLFLVTEFIAISNMFQIEFCRSSIRMFHANMVNLFIFCFAAKNELLDTTQHRDGALIKNSLLSCIDVGHALSEVGCNCGCNWTSIRKRTWTRVVNTLPFGCECKSE